MATHIETIINNCLHEIPETQPFNGLNIIRKLGVKAYLGMQFPSLNMQDDTTRSNAGHVETYLLARGFAVRVGNDIQLTEEGRKLKKIGEISEYDKMVWWRKNWVILTTLLTIVIAIMGLLLRYKGCVQQ